MLKVAYQSQEIELIPLIDDGDVYEPLPLEEIELNSDSYTETD